MWCILCLLLIALWMRSYWWSDSRGWVFSNQHAVVIESIAGRCLFSFGPPSAMGPTPTIFTAEVQSRFNHLYIDLNGPKLALRHHQYAGVTLFSIPYSLAVILSSCASIAPWFRWRFSLRTLFIAMTLVAIVLGVIVLSMQ
jgi:hypothetical protein